jgi:hypothetical protein
MHGRYARPTIIVASSVDSTFASGQCDACPAAPPITSVEGGGGTSRVGRFVFPLRQLVELDDEYSVVHAPHLRRGPIVLNRAAVAMLCHFEAASFLSEVPPAWLESWGAAEVWTTLARLVDLGLLVSEEVAENIET